MGLGSRTGLVRKVIYWTECGRRSMCWAMRGL